MYSTCIGLILKGYNDYEHKRKEFLNKFRKVEVPESLKTNAIAPPSTELAKEEVVNMKGRKNINGFWDKFKNNLIELFKEEEDKQI
jgi:cell division protein FtsA